MIYTKWTMYLLPVSAVIVLALMHWRWLNNVTYF